MTFTCVAKRNGYTLYKNKDSDKAIVRDSDNNTVFRGTHYTANQEFIRLTSKR